LQLTYSFGLKDLKLLADVRIGDFETFLVVRRTESITGAARELGVTPSQVSKAMARLEQLLQMRLLLRGARGVVLSADAVRATHHIEEIVRRASELRSSQTVLELTVAAPSFLNALFLPEIAQGLPGIRMRGIELPPALVRIYAPENLFDVAMMLGQPQFPSSWICSRVGEIRKALYGAPAVVKRLGRQPIEPSALADTQFVVPIYAHNGQFLVADEGCPLFQTRQVGHEVQTIALGLEMAARTDQVIFSPQMMAKDYVARGQLKVIEVAGWDVREEMYLACNSDRILEKTRVLLMQTLTQSITRFDATQ
jgi:DNA-binding transcriptional LysR family regulator